jgi:hypothetical protein
MSLISIRNLAENIPTNDVIETNTFNLLTENKKEKEEEEEERTRSS